MRFLLLYLLIGTLYAIVCYTLSEIIHIGKNLDKLYEESTPSSLKSDRTRIVFEAIIVGCTILFWPFDMIVCIKQNIFKK